MRIARVRVDAVAAPFPTPLRFRPEPFTMNTAVVVHVEEASSAVGFGYAPTFGYGTRALESLINVDIAPVLVERDLHDVAEAVATIAATSTHAGRQAGLVRQASAIVEIALWDLAAQLAGVPLHTYWGQPCGMARVYASGGWRHWPIEQLERQARSWIEAGFTGIKMQVGLGLEEDLARVRRIREVVGPGPALMLDANQLLDAHQAVVLAAAVAPWDPEWLEEPIRADDHESLVQLRSAALVPIAAGESESEPVALNHLVTRRAVDIIQPDVHRAGFELARQVAKRAATCGISTSPHMAHELSAHLVNGTGTDWLEYFDWFEDWWEAPIVPIRGSLKPSETPGHGVRLRSGWLETHRI